VSNLTLKLSLNKEADVHNGQNESKNKHVLKILKAGQFHQTSINRPKVKLSHFSLIKIYLCMGIVA
jgi:hypothetical protein